MKSKLPETAFRLLVAPALLGALAWTTAAAQPTDPLPSWNAGKTKQSLVDFVAAVTRPGSQFVPPAERIATFDNHGTLWAEQPMYFQLAFAVDRVKTLAPKHPEWKDQEPFKSVLAGDLNTALAGGTAALMQLMGATHANTTSDEFDAIVRDWLATAKHRRPGGCTPRWPISR